MSTETRITRLVVLPEGMQLFHDEATSVEIDDEAAGEFVVVKQVSEDNAGSISIDPSQWPALRDAIDRMIAECR